MSELRVNNIVGEDGISTPTFTKGVNITGVVTATTVNQVVSGVLTATSFSGPLVGSVTGNVSGNVTGSVTGTASSARDLVDTSDSVMVSCNPDGVVLTGIVTANTSIKCPTIQVGAGTTVHTTGIDLGTGTITGHNTLSTGVTTATTFNTNVFQSPAVAVGALSIDCSAGNYFTKTITAGTNTFTFDNVPTTGTAFSFTLELTHTGGTAAWPAAVKWPADTAPSLTNGKTSLFMFVTDDGGTRWRGNAIVDFTN